MSGPGGKQGVAELAAGVERDLRAVRQLLRRPVEAMVARGGLTAPQQAAMSILVKAGGASLKDLSRELGLAHSTVSGIVDRLQKKGLVERKTDPRDGRVTTIAASRQVMKFLREKWPALETHPLAEALGGASEAERRAIARGVRTLRRALERANGTARVAETRPVAES
jgi:DNA-binding MarR family transcriptional regulator